MNKPVQKRRRTVEIYFVLYLAALIFILPKNGEVGILDQQEETVIPVNEPDFALHLEKTTLTCNLIRDSAGFRIMSIDSMNTIFYSGDVEDVQFEFIIENQSLNRRLILNSEKNPGTKFFRIEERPDRKSAYFYWQPPRNDLGNKSYIVQVKATAKPASENDEAFQKTITRRAKFSLNIIITDREMERALASGEFIPGDTTDSSGMAFNTRDDIIRELVKGDIDLQPRFERVDALAYDNWHNQIFVIGADAKRDIKNLKINTISSPENNGGSASILAIDETNIMVGGKTPYSGNMKVRLSFARRYDDKVFSTDFKVYPKPIGRPEFDKMMYPEVSYVINSNLPNVVGKDALAILKSNDRVIVRSRQDSFEFTPDKDLVGDKIYLERYIGDELLDRNPITISEFPEPQIVRMTRIGEDKVRVETRSYGKFKGRENFVSELEVLDGNAKIFEKLGNPQQMMDQLIFTQNFEIIPKDPSDKFQFKIRAVDKRGKKSEIRNYEGQ